VVKDAITYPPWKWEDSDDAVKAYVALFAMLMLGQLPAAQQSGAFDIFYFLTLAVMTIYIGAHRGLTTDQRQQLNLKEVRPTPPCWLQSDGPSTVQHRGTGVRLPAAAAGHLPRGLAPPAQPQLLGACSGHCEAQRGCRNWVGDATTFLLGLQPTPDVLQCCTPALRIGTGT
jgi:hypothetical protein